MIALQAKEAIKQTKPALVRSASRGGSEGFPMPFRMCAPQQCVCATVRASGLIRMGREGVRRQDAVCRSSESSTPAARLTSSKWRPSSRLEVAANHRRARHTHEPAMPSRWFWGRAQESWERRSLGTVSVAGRKRLTDVAHRGAQRARRDVGNADFSPTC